MKKHDAELELLMSLGESDRRVLLLEQWIAEAEAELQQMIDSNKRDDDDIQLYKRLSKRAVKEYVESGDNDMLEQAKMLSEIIESTRRSRYTIGDIRKQRERVQWRRKTLARMKSKNGEPSQSSSH